MPQVVDRQIVGHGKKQGHQEVLLVVARGVVLLNGAPRVAQENYDERGEHHRWAKQIGVFFMRPRHVNCCAHRYQNQRSVYQQQPERDLVTAASIARNPVCDENKNS